MNQWIDDIRTRLSAAQLDPARELEIAQELAQHLDDRYGELVSAGTTPADARARALDELNDHALMREQLRQVEQLEPTIPVTGQPAHAGWPTGIWQDIRYSVRLLRANWSFTLLALATLAIGTGATTVIYAVIDNVLLRPVSYQDAGRLGRVGVLDPAYPGRRFAASFENFEAWRTRNRTLEAIAIYNSGSVTLLGDEPTRVAAAVITPEFFAANGVQPALGRGFTGADGEPGAELVVILSDGAWKRRFGADPAIVGQRITTTAGPRTIVGVLPDAKFFWGTTEFWLPLRCPAGTAAQAGQYPVLARLKDGVTFAQAEADLASIMRALHDEQALTGEVRGIGVHPMHEMTVGYLRATLYTLLGAVGCILLIACVNVAGLLVGAARRANTSCTCASRWARAAGGSPGSCSPKASCWRSRAGQQACCWPGGSSAR